jgi:hypothetical protein
MDVVPTIYSSVSIQAATYGWRKRYGTLEVADVRRLRELEAENTRLKKTSEPPRESRKLALSRSRS